MNREDSTRAQQLRREIEQLDAVTAEFIAAAGDLLSLSNARAREEVIELLGVNYVGPEMLGQLLYGNESKFQAVELDYVKLNKILNEPDEWESDKRKFETYALVFKPPISFLELKDRANEAANDQGKTPAFFISDTDSWYMTEAFATAIPKGGSWELVRRETVPGSTSRAWEEQEALIEPNLATTSFPALASLLVGQYLAHDIKLYNGKWHYGRTSTCASSGGPVYLGDMNAHGANSGTNSDDDDNAFAFDDVGLAVSRN